MRQIQKIWKRKENVRRDANSCAYIRLDYIQIVSNTVYTKWFEDLRKAMLDKHFPMNEMMKEHNTPILAETHIKYIHHVTLESNPVGRVWLSQLHASRWEVQLEIVEGDRAYCIGSQTGYYFNLDSRRPVRFPENLEDYYNSL